MGAEQVLEDPSAPNVATVTIPCDTQEKVLAARQVLALGKSQVWILGPVEMARAPWAIDPLTGGAIPYGGQIAGAADPYDEASDFVLAINVAVNATQFIVSRRAGGHLMPGQYLSIGPRLHTIVDLLSSDPTEVTTGLAVPGDIALSVRPWTRTAYSVGDAVEFGRPVCRMRITSDTKGLLLQLSKTGSITLEFIEAFYPAA